MPCKPAEEEVARQSGLVRDKFPRVDLSRARNDADDPSEEGRPTTDHEAKGWRGIPPSKP